MTVNYSAKSKVSTIGSEIAKWGTNCKTCKTKNSRCTWENSRRINLNN